MDYATTAVDVALTIKAMIEQSVRNSKDLSALSEELVNDCQDLEAKRQQMGEHGDPIVDQALKRLKSTLDKILVLCQEALVKKPGKRNLVKWHFNAFFYSDDIKKNITDAKANIEAARLRFVQDGVFALTLRHPSTSRKIENKSEESLSGDSGEDALTEASPSQDMEATQSRLKRTGSSRMQVTIIQLVEQVIASRIPTAPTRLAHSDEDVHFHDTVDLCFHTRTDEASVIESLTELLDEKDQDTSTIEWINSAVLVSANLQHLGYKEAHSIGERCCSLADSLRKQKPTIGYDVASAACYASLSLIKSASGQHQAALEAADKASNIVKEWMKSGTYRKNSDLGKDLTRRALIYEHARILALTGCGRLQEARQALETIFGASARPSAAVLEDEGHPHAHIELLLLDRWKVYLKLGRSEKETLQKLLELLCRKGSGPDSVPILRLFLRSTEGDAKRYEEERIDASTHICNVLGALHSELQRTVAILRDAVNGGLSHREEDYGTYTMRLAYAYNDRARTAQSIEAALEAAASRERLLKRNPGRKRYQRMLSTSLRAAANWQRRAKRFKEALANIDKAVALLHRLRMKDPSSPKFRDDYVKALLISSEIEAESEGYEESALEHAQMALAIIDDPREPPLLPETRSERAYAHYIIGKRLAEKNPDGAIGFLEAAINLYGVELKEEKKWYRLVELGLACDKAAELYLKKNDKRSALAHSTRGLEADREVVLERPALAYRLALHLQTKYDCLMRLNRYQDALGIASELVRVRRDLLEDDPTSERKMDVARALDAQAKAMLKLGQRAPAIELEKEALAIAQTEADRKPEVFDPWLFTFLSHLSDLYHECGEEAQSLETVERAIKYAETFVSKRPDDEKRLEDLVIRLRTAAQRLAALGRGTDAIHQLRYASTRCTQLTSLRSRKYTPLLIQVWDDEYEQLAALGRHHEAITILRLSIDARKKHGRKGMGRWAIASALNKLSTQLAQTGSKASLKEALTASEEAVKLERELVDAKLQRAGDRNLGIYLVTLGMRQAESNFSVEANLSFSEALTRLKSYLTSSPGDVREPYKMAQDGLKALAGGAKS